MNLLVPVWFVILCVDESAGVTVSSRWLQAAVALEEMKQNATRCACFFFVFMRQNLKQEAKTESKSFNAVTGYFSFFVSSHCFRDIDASQSGGHQSTGGFRKTA